MSRRRRRHNRYAHSYPYGDPYESDSFERDSFDRSYDEFEREILIRREPSPGIAAVLSVLIPGLGQVYNGRLLAGAVWFLATACAYSAVLLPGFLVHAFCVLSAYRGAEEA